VRHLSVTREPEGNELIRTEVVDLDLQVRRKQLAHPQPFAREDGRSSTIPSSN
jgi:hypothetical protein